MQNSTELNRNKFEFSLQAIVNSFLSRMKNLITFFSYVCSLLQNIFNEKNIGETLKCTTLLRLDTTSDILGVAYIFS